MSAHRLIIVDDHALFRQGLRALIEARGLEIVAEGSTAQEAVDLMQRHDGCILLLDVRLGHDRDGLWAAEQILKGDRDARVVLLTAYVDADVVMTATSLGVAGFIPKSSGSDQFFAAIEVVAAGGAVFADGSMARLGSGLAGLDYRPGDVTRRELGLSDREMEVLQLLGTPKTFAQIAAELYLSRKTVEHYAASLYRKLDVKSRHQAVMAAQERGLLTHG